MEGRKGMSKSIRHNQGKYVRNPDKRFISVNAYLLGTSDGWFADLIEANGSNDYFYEFTAMDVGVIRFLYRSPQELGFYIAKAIEGYFPSVLVEKVAVNHVRY